MNPYTDNPELDALVRERMETLPAGLKRLFDDPASSIYIQTFGASVGLSADQIQHLEHEIMLLMLGFTPREDFSFVLMTELDMQPRQAFAVEHWVTTIFLKDALNEIGTSVPAPVVGTATAAPTTSAAVEAPLSGALTGSAVQTYAAAPEVLVHPVSTVAYSASPVATPESQIQQPPTPQPVVTYAPPTPQPPVAEPSVVVVQQAQPSTPVSVEVPTVYVAPSVAVQATPAPAPQPTPVAQPVSVQVAPKPLPIPVQPVSTPQQASSAVPVSLTPPPAAIHTPAPLPVPVAPLPVPVRQVLPPVPRITSVASTTIDLNKKAPKPRTIFEDVAAARGAISPEGVARYDKPLTPTPAYGT